MAFSSSNLYHLWWTMTSMTMSKAAFRMIASKRQAFTDLSSSSHSSKRKYLMFRSCCGSGQHLHISLRPNTAQAEAAII